MYWELLSQMLTAVSNVLTIGAAGIALYIFFFRGREIYAVFQVLKSHALQITLSELTFKLERLNDFDADDASQKSEILKLLSEIQGQITGNKPLRAQLSTQLASIKLYINNPAKLSETRKRSFVFELRETIRTVDIENLQELTSKKS